MASQNLLKAAEVFVDIDNLDVKKILSDMTPQTIPNLTACRSYLSDHLDIDGFAEGQFEDFVNALYTAIAPKPMLKATLKTTKTKTETKTETKTVRSANTFAFFTGYLAKLRKNQVEDVDIALVDVPTFGKSEKVKELYKLHKDEIDEIFVASKFIETEDVTMTKVTLKSIMEVISDGESDVVVTSLIWALINSETKDKFKSMATENSTATTSTKSKSKATDGEKEKRAPNAYALFTGLCAKKSDLELELLEAPKFGAKSEKGLSNYNRVHNVLEPFLGKKATIATLIDVFAR
jgi:hypothetical protein